MNTSNHLPHVLRFLLVLLTVFAATAGVSAQVSAAQWLAVETPKESVFVLADDGSGADAEKIDVLVKEGLVYVTVNRPAAVKVFSILGQPVASRTIQPGTTRLKLPLRGIYILKVGEATRRINI